MRAVLQAISEELARLKAEGEQVVSVSEEALAGLRALVKARVPADIPAAGSAAPRDSASRGTGSPAASGAILSAFDASAPKKTTGPVVRLAPAAPAAATLPPPPVVVLPEGDKATRYAALREMATTHPVCLANVRPGKKAVLGVGPLDAKIFFVGEAPGAEEEVKGEPFVGPAGQLLTKMIGAMGLKREQVYIGNIMCWRPQMPTPPGAEQIGNRPPTPEEMAFCLPFLRASIEIVQPELLVALGGTAAQGLLGEKFTTLGAARSKWHDFAGKPLMVTYHPSYLLRNGSNRAKRMVWEDLLKVMERAGLPISEKQRNYFL
jgi:uracil-DNA glycosylase, family 4